MTRKSGVTQTDVLLTADPASPVEGERWYRSDLKEWRGRDSVNSIRLGPNYNDQLNAEDAGIICWNYPPLGLPNQTVLPTAGVIYLERLPWRKSGPLTKICYAVNTLAATLTANQNYVGAYSSAGTLIGATAAGDVETATALTGWLSTGWKESSLSGGPFTVAGSPTGFIWAAFLSNGTTRPAIGKSSGTPSLFALNFGVAAASTFTGHILTGQTVLPGTITPSSIVQDANNFWCGTK
jgi:hypothetical protein